MASERSMLADVFDEFFSEDFDSLQNVSKILEEFTAKEQRLSDSIVTSEEKTSNNLTTIMNKCNELVKDLERIQNQIKEILDSSDKHDSSCAKMKKELSKSMTEKEQLDKEASYQLWLKKIEEFSSSIKTYKDNGDLNSGVNTHAKLYLLCSSIESTKCENLQKYSYNVCESLYELLKEAIESKFGDLLSSIKYPFPTGISAPCFNKKDESEEQFRELLTMSVKLESLAINSKYSLVSILLTNPLKKRFHFHFYGKRHTNNIEKPEWFYTQVLNWIRDHGLFIEEYVEPLLQESTGDDDFTLKHEFSEILVELCKEKLMASLEETVENDFLLAHLIDETMLFDRELKEITTRDTEDLNCIKVLLQNDYIEKWLLLEKKFSLERMREQVEQDDAWLPKVSKLKIVTEKDLTFYVPKCVEKFITLLSSMTGRYENISEKGVQRRFLDILEHSLDAFIVELKHKASVERIQPESQSFCSIINGAFYINHVINEWANDLQFITLFSQPYDVSIDDTGSQDNDILFADVSASLDKFIIDMLESLVEYMRDGAQTKIKPYKSESWHSLPPMKDYAAPSLSPGACNMMLFMKEHMHTLEGRLYGEVFERFWKQFSVVIDKLIFEEIVLDSHFNEGGAAQLQFDVKKNLLVLFSQYTTRAEAYFKLLKESCCLLNLMPGSALLIKEQLNKYGMALPKRTIPAEKEEVIKNILIEHSVKYLTIDQVFQIINSRIDWPKVT